MNYSIGVFFFDETHILFSMPGLSHSEVVSALLKYFRQGYVELEEDYVYYPLSGIKVIKIFEDDE